MIKLFISFDFYGKLVGINQIQTSGKKQGSECELIDGYKMRERSSLINTFIGELAKS